MIKVGQWVNSYSKGIFRIERILDRYYDEFDPLTDPKKKVGDKYDDRIVVTKRLLNSKFKKSISYDSCSEFFIVPLDKEQKERLQEILKQNPDWLTELNDYSIPDIHTVYNWSVQLNSKEKIEVNEI